MYIVGPYFNYKQKKQSEKKDKKWVLAGQLSGPEFRYVHLC